jgi:hypothetical protein
MAYIDPNTVHNPATGTVAPAAWGDTIRDDLEFLIDPPACSARNSTTQSINNTTFTVLTANSENFDNNAMHSTVTNTSRITCQTAGRYLFFTRHRWATNGTGARVIQYRINGVDPGATAQQLMAVPAAGGGVDHQHTATWSLTLAAGDYVEVAGYQDSGVALNVTLEEFAATFLTR